MSEDLEQRLADARWRVHELASNLSSDTFPRHSDSRPPPDDDDCADGRLGTAVAGAQASR